MPANVETMFYVREKPCFMATFLVLVHILQFPYLTLACATVRLAIYQTPCVQFFT